MAFLRFFDGLNNIGGTKILFSTFENKKEAAEEKSSDKKSQIFLDFGMNYSTRGLYFEEYLNPRPSNGLPDLLQTKLLPLINSYRNDLLELMKLLEDPFLNLLEDIGNIDGVLLSHAHYDHSAYISFLKEEIPIYLSKETFKMIKAVEETQNSSFETSIIKTIKRPNLGKAEYLSRIFFDDILKADGFRIKDILVKAFAVDHSIPGACSFFVEYDSGTLIYTGDLRLHGKEKEKSFKFLESASKLKTKYLIIEGTNLNSGILKEFWTEERVLEEALKISKGTDGLIVAEFSMKDLNRLKTFYEVAKSVKRKFVITLRDAYLIEELRSVGFDIPSIFDKNIYIYIKKKRSGLNLVEDYEKWEKELLNKIYPQNLTFKKSKKDDSEDKKMTPVQKGLKILSSKDIANNQQDFLLCLGFFDLQEFVDIKPKEGSLYIHSQSEAHSEEQEIDLRRLNNWLELFKFKRVHIHASGHARGEDLLKIVEAINPEYIIPIHTQNPSFYKDIYKEKVLLLQNGDTIKI